MPKRDITLPPVHNTRSPEQWRIISQHVDFEDKTVLDLGCGYGDLLWRAWAAGAKNIEGVEHNLDIQRRLGELAWSTKIPMRAEELGFTPHYTTVANVINNWSGSYNIVICFSVLAYLNNAHDVLKWIHNRSTQALIECQLFGDGPGPYWLKSPQDMRRWLDSIGWKSVQRIGETVVKDRGAKRGIWLCQR